MYIVETTKTNTKEFKHIPVGEAFKNDNEFFLKTDVSNFAVSLNDGRMVYFEENKIIIPINAKITVSPMEQE